jgi:hypothetical protein
MRAFHLPRPSAALVVSIVALIVALGGTSYAAFTLPKNSVGTKQLKNNAVTSSKIKNGAVTASKLNTSGVTVPNATHANSADSATNAGHASAADNANALGGSPPSAFESASNVLSAVVTNNGTTATVVRGTPGTTAFRSGPGNVRVVFPRDVSNCTWTATQGNPGSTFVPGDFATVRGDGTATHVEVITYNTTATQIDVNFHIIVVC